jgi:phosphatidylglycerol:prolipoprotein diacylglycerol transferase
MRRILVQRHGVTLWSYPTLALVGTFAGIVVENAAANAGGMDAARVYAATVLLLVPAFVGARVAYLVGAWRHYRSIPGAVWDRSRGGMALYGAIPAMLGASVPLLAALDVPFWRFWDVATFCILVGMIFTRAGCLLNGCCEGRPTSSRLGINLPDAHGRWERRYPSQLFEAGLAIVLLAAASLLWARDTFPGSVFLSALAGYAAGRFLLQTTRARRTLYAGIDAPQAFSVVLAAASILGLVVLAP